ncbi:hypothetical protein BaRGS_00020929 [Batillaria attramentaria]|uniref:Uncharacterized protein n=1 Tax=Batillaria attramentaria TaxID=370345 RepID=A0ABD0KLD9_9CAEN
MRLPDLRMERTNSFYQYLCLPLQGDLYTPNSWVLPPVVRYSERCKWPPSRSQSGTQSGKQVGTQSGNHVDDHRVIVLGGQTTSSHFQPAVMLSDIWRDEPTFTAPTNNTNILLNFLLITPRNICVFD